MTASASPGYDGNAAEKANSSLERAGQMIEKGELAEAAAILEELAGEGMLLPAALNDLAVIDLLAGRTAHARSRLEQILRIDPANEVALDNLAQMERLARSRIPAERSVSPVAGYPGMPTVFYRSLDEYRAEGPRRDELFRRRRNYEKSLLTGPGDFSIPGWCSVCREERLFKIDYLYAAPPEKGGEPNWRERLICDGCGFNNRQRAACHFFMEWCQPGRDARIYLTEQTTPFYAMLVERFPGTTGSEYLRDAVPRGTRNAGGIRNEDLTRLSFSAASFDFLLTFDVLEHVPGPARALAECRRVLSAGGKMIISVPFAANSRTNIQRAFIDGKGELVHLLPPEFHGDPMDPGGCLVFQVFGWELLEQLKEAGFRDARAGFYWSNLYGYLGGQQLLLLAEC